MTRIVKLSAAVNEIFPLDNLINYNCFFPNFSGRGGGGSRGGGGGGDRDRSRSRERR